VRFAVRDTTFHKVLTLNEESEIPGIVHSGNLDQAMEATTLDVDADILSCTITKSKERAAGSIDITLAPTQTDYHVEIHPGDHVLIWMKRNKTTRDYSNSFTSGFKTWGVVTSVREQKITTGDGFKSTRYQVTGEDFGHFLETDLYFNPILASKLKDTFGVLYPTLHALVDDTFGDPSANAHNLLSAFIGTNLNKGSASPIEDVTPIGVFQLPRAVTKMFDVQADATLSDILYRQIGVLQYFSTSADPIVAAKLAGFKFLNIETTSKFDLWSVLKTHTNPTLNEMFLDIRPVGPDSKLQPVVVIRQIPYTSQAGQSQIRELGRSMETALFTNLPTITVPESFVISEELVRSEQSRWNFIQMTGTGAAMLKDDLIPFQTLSGNFAVDKRSIARHGMRTMTPHTDADLSQPPNSSVEGGGVDENGDFVGVSVTVNTGSKTPITLVPDWILLYADWYLRAHLLETGTFQMIGIEEPICLGDNLRIERETGYVELHHIQTYTHSYQVGGDGQKSFRTTVSTTRGQNEDETPISSRRSDDIFTVVKRDRVPSNNTRID
jgi:hypothetical protein